jgi:hypothetical protein
MQKDITVDAMYWAQIGDNRFGPLIAELIEGLADSEDPHLVRKVARRLRMLAGSLESMSHKMAEKHHDKWTCPMCTHGSVFST